MLDPRNFWVRLAVVLLVVGFASLLIPHYTQYCETDNSYQYNCAPYEFVVTIVGIAQIYNGLITALATFAIAWFTWTIKSINSEQIAHTKTIERAYVKLSHRPPGIGIMTETNFFEATIGVKNHGRTPARITDVLVCALVLPHGEALPEIPSYTRSDTRIPKGFLVADDEFFYWRYYQLAEGEIHDILDLMCDLYLIGYVDYVDQFNQRHRGGYARTYRPRIDDRAPYKTEEAFLSRNNLIFVSQDGYNYDRLRTRGEGNDWDEKS